MVQVLVTNITPLEFVHLRRETGNTKVKYLSSDGIHAIYPPSHRVPQARLTSDRQAFNTSHRKPDENIPEGLKEMKVVQAIYPHVMT